MNPAQLGLRSAAPSTDGAVAWFVPGSDAREWVEEVLRFGFDPTTVRLLPVPRSRVDRHPVGVVVLSPERVVPRVVRRAQPWRMRAECVLHPIDAEVWPPVTDTELRGLVGAKWLVLHPTIGAISYAEEDVAGLTDLVTAAAVDEDAWDAAVAGPPAPPGLAEVLPESPPDARTLFSAEAKEIGASTPDELPPLDSEPRDVAARLLRPSVQRLARWVKEWADRRPRTASGPTWVDWLGSLARRWIMPEEPARRRELARLLAMLDADPRRGLRFALPLWTPASRGRASPSNRLGRRSTRFDPAELDNAAPRDAWDVPPSVRAELEQRYRALATKEAADGEHRRAAYILAHLLGDFAAAARVLRAGRFHREAAALYRDRLKDLRSASECLVEGGLLGEAALLEEQAGSHERAGDLWLLLGQTERALVRYRAARDAAVERKDWIAAAMLIAEKLRDPDDALRLLRERWLVAGDASAFAAWLALQQRVGGDGEIVRELEVVVSGTVPSRLPGVVAVLGKFALRVGEGELRDAVRDAVRRLVARVLPSSPGSIVPVLMEAVRRASRDDLVLAADTRRVQVSRTKLVPPRGGAPRLERLEQRLLHGIAGWVHAVATTRRLVLLHEDGTSTFRGWSIAGISGGTEQRDWRTRWIVPARFDGQVWGCAMHQPRLERVDPADPGRVTATVHLPIATRCFAADDDGAVWFAHADEPGWQLSRASPDDQVVTSERLAEELPTLVASDPVAHEREPFLCAVSGCVLFAFESTLARRDHGGRWSFVRLPGAVRALVRSEEGGNPVVLVEHENGTLACNVFAGDLDRMQPLARELDRPVTGWTRNGIAILADERQVVLYERVHGSLVHIGDVAYTAGMPTRILPTPAVDEVVFLARQTITRIAIRRRRVRS